MLQRQSDGLTAALVKVDAWLRRNPQADLEAVGRRIGRALGQYPSATAILPAQVRTDGEGRASRLEITS